MGKLLDFVGSNVGSSDFDGLDRGSGN